MSDLDPQDERIASILNQTEVPDVDEETLALYLDYLRKNFDTSLEVTGIDDFDWEEFYVFGPGSKKEYEKLRKTNPSFQDTYHIIKFDNDIDENYGLIVTVKRISDKKKFQLPLADLQVKDENHSGFELLDDYSVWFCNWR